MIGTLIGIIFALIIIGVIWWALQQLLALVPIAEPFRTIIYVLCVIIMVLIVLWIISVLLGMAGIHVPRFGFLGAEPDRAVAALSATATADL
jgi:hypothetical protein